MYYDYQLSNERQNFGDEALAVKMTVLLLAISLVSNGNKTNSHASLKISDALLLLTSKVDKLQLDTEPVSYDKTMIRTLKPGY